MTAIWAASPVTPAATHRVPVDVSSSGAPSYITGQNIADINTIIGGTVTALGSIGTNTALNLALGGYFSHARDAEGRITGVAMPGDEDYDSLD